MPAMIVYTDTAHVRHTILASIIMYIALLLLIKT